MWTRGCPGSRKRFQRKGAVLMIQSVMNWENTSSKYHATHHQAYLIPHTDILCIIMLYAQFNLILHDNAQLEWHSFMKANFFSSVNIKLVLWDFLSLSARFQDDRRMINCQRLHLYYVSCIALLTLPDLSLAQPKMRKSGAKKNRKKSWSFSLRPRRLRVCVGVFILQL